MTDPTPLLWGSYTPQHLITLAIIPLFCLALYLLVKHISERQGTGILFVLSLWGIAAVIYNLLMWGTPLEYLPLHLCSVNAVLLPIALLTKSKIIGNMLPIFSLGALAAILCNQGVSNVEMASWVFVMYYVPHLMEFSIPLVMLLTGRIRVSLKSIFPTVLCLGVLTAVVHMVNCGLNRYFLENGIVNYLGQTVQVNYMYTVGHENIPILKQLWQMIPYPFFYELPLLIVIVGVLVLLSLPNRPKHKGA